MSKLKTIIWGADPLEDRKVSERSIAVLRDLSRRTGAKIEPVYVLSDGLIGLSVPKADLVQTFKKPSERALAQLVKKTGLSNVAPPKVIVAAPSSRSSAAEALDRYARSRGAAAIFVESHGRRGLSRAVLGSFAETLVLHSKTPVLLSGPHARHVRKLANILFPTDFSKASKKAFARATELAGAVGARLTLFYAVVNPLDPFVASGVGLLGGGYVSVQGLVEQTYSRQRAEASRWVAAARARGIEVTIQFDVASTSVAQSVLSFARRRHSDLIIMASESGAVSAALLGSVGRVVGREAPCPVWFVRK